jgi:hypothetical protein
MSYILSIGAIFKNEASYLKEWIEHYLARGVDHFYLINDNSNDDYLKILNKYKEKITLFHISEQFNSYGRQDYFYNKYLFPVLSETKWILICDIDEYVWSPIYLNLKESIAQCENNKAYYIKIPEIIFGNNGYEKQPQDIVNSFTKRMNIDQKYFDYVEHRKKYKTLAKSSILNDLRVHCHWSNEIQHAQNSINLNSNILRMNHYRFQSVEKWTERLKLTDSNGYTPRSKIAFCYGLTGMVKYNGENYRTLELYNEANKVCNQIEDLDLINQNKKYNLL